MRSGAQIRNALLGVVLFSGATQLQAEVRTSISNGAWSTPATWSGGEVPTSADDCIIEHSVYFDLQAGGGPHCSSLRIRSGGALAGFNSPLQIGGRGPGLAGGIDIESGGALQLMGTEILEIAADPGDLALDGLRVHAGGRLVAVGSLLAAGTVSEPPGFLGTSVADGDFVLSDETASWPVFPAGSILRVGSGAGATWWFNVVENDSSSIQLDFTSHGNSEPTETLQVPPLAYSTETAFRTPQVGDAFEVFSAVVLRGVDNAGSEILPWHLRFLPGSSFSVQYAAIRDFSVIEFDSVDFDASPASSWDVVETGPGCESGISAMIILKGTVNARLTRGLLRDARNPLAPDRCHGILFTRNDDGEPNRNTLISGFQVTRLNDDGILLDVAGQDGTAAAEGCVIEDSVIHDLPRWNSGTTTQAIEMDSGFECVLRRNRLFNIQDDIVQAAGKSGIPLGSVAIHDNVLVNSRLGGGVRVANNANLDVDVLNVVNNYVGNTWMACTAGGRQTGNFLTACNQSVSGTEGFMRSPAVARGNVLAGNDTGTGILLNNNDDFPPEVLIVSNLLVDFDAAGLAIAQNLETVEERVEVRHLTIDMKRDADGAERGVLDQRPSSSGWEHTLDSLLIAEAAEGIRGNSTSMTPLTADYGLCSECGQFYAGLDLSPSPSDMEAAVTFTQPASLIYDLPAGSPARTNPGSSGQPRGLLWAGTLSTRLPGLVPPLPISNVAGFPDSDLDALVDPWDNCPTSSNIEQFDRDDDGVGDACDNCPEEPNSLQDNEDGDPAGASCDCDDAAASVFPGAEQVCNGVNDDCADAEWPDIPPGELDSDMDQVLVCEGDCDDDDELIWRVPSSPSGLSWTVSSEGTTVLVWQAPADPGASEISYDVLRSGNSVGFESALCLETDDSEDAAATEFTVPTSGEAFFYLVRAENECVGGQSSLGTSSSGLERQGRDCP